MCSTKANYSWDLQMKKYRNLVFIDKRDEDNIMQYETVSETAPNDIQPMDDDTKDGIRQLMKETA